MGGSSECAKRVEAHREKDENREIQHISGSVESSKMRWRRNPAWFLSSRGFVMDPKTMEIKMGHDDRECTAPLKCLGRNPKIHIDSKVIINASKSSPLISHRILVDLATRITSRAKTEKFRESRCVDLDV